MTFETLRKNALSEWQTLISSNQTRILVGSATCGRASGASTVLEAIRKELARRNIQATIIEVGCIGTC